MKKGFIVGIFLLLLNITIVPNALAARNVLDVPAFSQEKDGWCWASADKSIIDFCEGSSPPGI
ncbi:MAG: hypothetical protein K9L17_04875 [Clostridiales bacterium]|nr:hypothetical protein [Clostridiales bacterium]MCF8022007.1 hypothetical protein [Clostridiales bacterium]